MIQLDADAQFNLTVNAQDEILAQVMALWK